MKKTKLFIIFTIIISILLSSCGKKNDNEKKGPVFEGGIVLGALKDTTINPLVTKLHTNAMTYSIIYSPLFKTNEDLSVENILVDSYHSDDGINYTFTLKEIKFSDNTPLTSDNVITSLNLIKENPDNAYHQIFDYISSYKKISKNEFQITLHSQGISFLAVMNFPIVKDKDSNIGCGPFKIKNLTEEEATLEANATSPQLPKFKTVIIKSFPSKDVFYDAFSNNEIDVINTDIYNLAQFSAKTNINTYDYISDNLTFLGFNGQKEMFMDINIKKAIARLINKEELTSSILVGHAIKTASPFKPNSIYKTDYDYSYDVDKATKDLEKSEKKFSDIAFTLLVNKDNISAKNTAEFVANTLNTAGITAYLDYQSRSDYLYKISTDDFDAFIGETTLPSNGDISFLFKEDNIFNFTNTKLNDTLYAFNLANTFEKKIAQAKELNKVYLNTLPFVSLYFKTDMLSVSNKIKGNFETSSTDIYKSICSWKK